MPSFKPAPTCTECQAKGFCAAVSGLPEEMRAEAKKHFVHRHLDRGECLFREGDSPTGFWILCSGKMKILRQAPDGKPLITRVISPGEVLGHRAFFAGQTFQASAEAMEYSRAAFLDRPVLEHLARRFNSFSQFMMRRLAVDLDRAEVMATNMAYRGARDRVLDVLYDIHIKNLLVGDQSWQFSIRRQDLAELAGLSVETIVRVLKALEKEGFLQLAGRKINVVDSKKLLESVRMGLFEEN